MAPEAFDGKRSERTDIWAVGVIFYQLLAGRLPYDQQDTSAIIAAIMFNEPPALPQSVPEIVRRIVTTAIQREPTQRFASAVDMLRACVRPSVSTVSPSPPAHVVPVGPPPLPGVTPTIPGPPRFVPTITSPVPDVPAISPTLPDVAPKKKTRFNIHPRAVILFVVVFMSVFCSVVGFAVWDWSSRHGARLVLRTGAVPVRLKFSPDGKTLLSINDLGGTSVQVWSLDSGVLRLNLEGQKSAVTPDGKTLVISDGQKVNLFDPQTGGVQRTLSTTVNGNDWLWCSEGETLATYHSGDQKIVLWDLVTGAPREMWKPQLGYPIALSSDNKMLATKVHDSNKDVDTVSLWDEAGNLKRQFEFPGYIVEAQFSFDGNMIAVSGFETVKLWDVQSGTLKLTSKGSIFFFRQKAKACSLRTKRTAT